jgi:hypothetical protein
MMGAKQRASALMVMGARGGEGGLQDKGGGTDVSSCFWKARGTNRFVFVVGFRVAGHVLVANSLGVRCPQTKHWSSVHLRLPHSPFSPR